jgi:hypothetical protein
VVVTIRRGGTPSIEVWRRESNRQWKKMVSSLEHLTAVHAVPLKGGKGIALIGEVPEQEPGLPLAIKCIPLNGVPETVVYRVKNQESACVTLQGVHAYGEVLSLFITETDLSRDTEVRLLCIRSRDGGNSWAEPSVVADGLPTSEAFKVWVDGDRMGCFFKDYQKDLRGDVWFVSTDDGGENWRKRKVPFALAEDEAAPSAMPVAAFADADLVSLVYLQITKRGGEGHETAGRYAMISLNNQGTWGPLRWITPELPGSAIVSSGAKAFGAGQRYMMSYRYALGDTPEQRVANQRAGKLSIQRLTSSDGGETWQSLEWKAFATPYSEEHTWGVSPDGQEILFAADILGDNESPGECWMYAQEFELVSSNERRKSD